MRVTPASCVDLILFVSLYPTSHCFCSKLLHKQRNLRQLGWWKNLLFFAAVLAAVAERLSQGWNLWDTFQHISALVSRELHYPHILFLSPLREYDTHLTTEDRRLSVTPNRDWSRCRGMKAGPGTVSHNILRLADRSRCDVNVQNRC